MKLIHMDLHTHTQYSDGDFTPEQIIEAAIEKNLEYIAITDHFLTYKTHSIQISELEQYLNHLDRLKIQHGSKIKIFKALEIDLLDLVKTGRTLPDSEVFNRLDFLLMEYAGERPMMEIPLHFVFKIRTLTSKPCILAHTDCEMAFPSMSPSLLIDRLVDNKIYLELNESYFRRGENRPYYEYLVPYMEQTRNRHFFFSVGSDTHDNLETIGAQSAAAFLFSQGLSERIFIPEQTD